MDFPLRHNPSYPSQPGLVSPWRKVPGLFSFDRDLALGPAILIFPSQESSTGTFKIFYFPRKTPRV